MGQVNTLPTQGELFADGELIGKIGKIGDFIRRHPKTASAGGAILVATLGAGGYMALNRSYPTGEEAGRAANAAAQTETALKPPGQGYDIMNPKIKGGFFDGFKWVVPEGTDALTTVPRHPKDGERVEYDITAVDDLLMSKYFRADKSAFHEFTDFRVHFMGAGTVNGLEGAARLMGHKDGKEYVVNAPAGIRIVY